MSAEYRPVSILPESECWSLLRGVALGRFVTCADGRPELFPVNFVVRDRTVLFRTAEGTKLTSTAISDHVLFEADSHTEAEGWSVVVKGTARPVQDDGPILEALETELFPWTATAKEHVVRIRPERVTGRRFVFGPDLGVQPPPA
ncbi:pyridoxamine 5'-phosphate oxidase [Mycobacterium sp. IS-1496]|uniref:pyridoxamine 5'-phosphate oxidase family protein n=1 Tax=Mycobacterium sp. IS-1496 TaxID=1772284 RepID=UPI0007415FA8|nr:pyridoxamine 5'-phosphate oxidase family protein [Mycobacterium sp. IS-1496]KUI31495.1 pyridoxamine 5'-phosphate oxidase [Mycobacterium sp. IS-1496]